MITFICHRKEFRTILDEQIYSQTRILRSTLSVVHRKSRKSLNEDRWKIKLRLSCSVNLKTPTHRNDIGLSVIPLWTPSLQHLIQKNHLLFKVLRKKFYLRVYDNNINYLANFRLELCHSTMTFQHQENLEQKALATVKGWPRRSLQILKRWRDTYATWYHMVRTLTHHISNISGNILALDIC